MAVFPILVLYVPTGQSVQLLALGAPFIPEYFPALQFTHVAFEDAADAVEYLPASQSVHESLPSVVLNFPGAQAVHSPPSGPWNPLLQRQLLAVDDAGGDCELALQFMHRLPLELPTVLEYVFALQFKHADAPNISTYLPASQFEHSVDPCAAL